MSIHKTGRKILILGAGADMARPFLQLLFTEWKSCMFYLLARNVAALQDLVEAGKAQGHTIETHWYDLQRPAELHFFDVEFCITYAGWLPDDKEAVEKSMLLNYTGVRRFTDALLIDSQSTLKQIIFTGSVAGVRCRPANRAYGLAKAALHKYALELHEKWKGQIAITLVIPGFVQTRMITGMKTPGILTHTPEKLARQYVDWMERQPKLVYSQPIWRFISVGLRLMPEFIVKRMKK